LKGFTYTVELLRADIDAIYDITVAYPDYVPETEASIFTGKFPKEIHFHCHRVPIASLPQSEKELEQWCNERWREKEQLLSDFYRTKKFLGGKPITHPNESAISFFSLFIVVFWLSTLALILYGLYQSSSLRWYYLFVNLSAYLVSKFLKGFDWLESGLLALPTKNTTTTTAAATAATKRD
jgi:lysocardiolipin and lysophospholipid acyltransferase